MKLLLSIVFILSSITIYSQELLKEVSKTFDNGQPMYIDYVEMENLKKVKTEMFNEDGKLIFSMENFPVSTVKEAKDEFKRIFPCAKKKPSKNITPVSYLKSYYPN